MPYAHGPSVKKLSKMATLLLGRNYILMLTRTVEHLRRLLAEAYAPPAAIAALAAAKHPRSAGALVPHLPPHPAHQPGPSVGHLPPVHLAPGLPGATALGVPHSSPAALTTESLLRMAPRLPPLGLDMGSLGSPEMGHTLPPQSSRAPFDLLKTTLVHPEHFLASHPYPDAPPVKLPRLSPENLRGAPRGGEKDLPLLKRGSPPAAGDHASVVRPIPTLPTEGPGTAANLARSLSPTPSRPHRPHHPHPFHATSPRVPYSCCVSTVYS